MATIVCPSGKRRYVRRRFALRDLKRAQARGATVRRVYECPSCAGYHMTSKREQY